MTKAMDNSSFGMEWDQKSLVDLDFADDISARGHTLAGLQEIANTIDTVGAKIGFMINCKKTKAMKIGPERHPPILIMQQNVNYVEKFRYLGSYMSSDGDSEPNVRAKIGKVASIFQRLLHGNQLPAVTINLNVKLCLQEIVSIGRRQMAGHVPRLQRERPAHTATYVGLYWVPEDGRRKILSGSQRRHGEALSKKTWETWVLAGMEPAGSSVT